MKRHECVLLCEWCCYQLTDERGSGHVSCNVHAIYSPYNRLSICYYSILPKGRSMRQVCILLGTERSCRLCLWFMYSGAPMEKKLVLEILIVLTDLQPRLEMNSCLPTPLSNTVRLRLSGREASNTCAY